MKSSALPLLIAVFLAGAAASESVLAAKGRSGGGKSGWHHKHHHHHHHRHRHFFGAGFGVFAGPWYYPAYVYVEPPPVMYYIERGDADSTGSTWLYCPGPNAYFPDVTECMNGWQTLPAAP